VKHARRAAPRPAPARVPLRHRLRREHALPENGFCGEIYHFAARDSILISPRLDLLTSALRASPLRREAEETLGRRASGSRGLKAVLRMMGNPSPCAAWAARRHLAARPTPICMRSGPSRGRCPAGTRSRRSSPGGSPRRGRSRADRSRRPTRRRVERASCSRAEAASRVSRPAPSRRRRGIRSHTDGGCGGAGPTLALPVCYPQLTESGSAWRPKLF
jgi:hypothetical protein